MPFFSMALVASFGVLMLSIFALFDWLEAPRKVLAWFCLGLAVLGVPTCLVGLSGHLIVNQSHIHWGWLSFFASIFLLFAFFAAIIANSITEQRRSLPPKRRDNLSQDYAILAVFTLLALASYLGAVVSVFTYQ